MHRFAALLAVVFAATAAVASPSAYEQDFTDMTVSDFSPVSGRAHEGSTLDIAQDPAASSNQALRLSYQFSGPGHVGIGWASRPQINVEGDHLAVRLRVRGTGQDHFTKANIRFVDANGEFLQYPILPLVEALNGTGWREVRGRVNLEAFASSWGGSDEGREAVDRPVRFQGFAFDYRGQGAAEGEIFIDDLAISEVMDAKHGLELVVEADRQLPIFDPQEPIELTVTLQQAGVSDQAATGTVDWRAYDFDGAEVASGSEPITWGESGAEPVAIHFAPDEPGIFYVDADLLDEQGVILSQAHTRAAAFRAHERPVASEPFIFGVGAHPARSPNDEAVKEIDLARAIGFSAFRFDFTWTRMEPQEGQFVWDQYDVLVDAFERNGIMPQAVVGFSPRWASTNPDTDNWREWTMAPPRVEPYLDFLRRSVERYGDRITYWEIWNEPDIKFWLGTLDEYVDLFNASITAIHEVDPQAKVMNGGFSETKRQPNFIPDFLEQANPKPDIVAFHSHNAFRDFVQTGKDIVKYLDDAGLSDTPVWMNEAGATNHSGTTERAQAILTIKRLAYAPSLGHEAYLWYDLRNDGEDPNEGEHNYGLVLRDFSPKASAVAAHHVITQLAGKRFVRRFDLDENLFALLYSDGQHSVLVAWNEHTSGGDHPLLFRTNAQRVRTMNIMGVETDLASADGIVAVNFRHEPYFILLDGEPDLDLIGNLVEVPPAWRGAPGRAGKASVELTNPFSHRLTGELSLKTTEGWTVTPEKVRVDLAPDGEQSVTVELRAASSVDTGSMHVELQTDALAQTLRATTLLEPAIIAPRITWAEAQAGLPTSHNPQAALDQRSNYVSLFEATPMRELHFTGPDDLSAEVFIGHDDDGIILIVQARDDVHVQDEEVGEMWRGDSLQVALATPTGEFYEWTIGLTASGPRAMLHHAPPSVGRGEQQMDIVATREGDLTTYVVRIDRDLPGVAAALEQGCGLNVLVNDNDGIDRKGWVEWTPGIGQAKDPSLYPSIIFD